jgi:intracellular sulfur oxidation DsrE/DsrF family protein
MTLRLISRKLIALLALMVLIPSLSFAADRKMAIQLNSSDPLTQKMALLNARNLKAVIGKDAIDVEVVVYGPGLGVLKKENTNSSRIQDLMQKYGLKVSVCEGTLKNFAKRHGKEADIIDGVARVKTGAIRLLELQEQGYHYMRP